MPKDTIDSMIESWAGHNRTKKPVPAPTKAPEPPKVEAQPEEPAKAPGTPLDAAHAIYEALRVSTGRRPSVSSWVKVARETLGLGRLTQKRYQGVLEEGYRAKLFRLDEETLSYPILVALEPEPEEEPEPEVTEPPRRRDSPPVPLTLPEDFNPPGFVACGHSSRQYVPDPDRPAIQSKTGQEIVYRTTVLVEGPGPEKCPACAAGQPGNPRYQTGEWRKPIPEAGRRTVDKSQSTFPGFPGLCSDPKTGLYIGGLANDCSRYHEGPERCVYHASYATPSSKKRKSPSDPRKENT